MQYSVIDKAGLFRPASLATRLLPFATPLQAVQKRYLVFSPCSRGSANLNAGAKPSISLYISRVNKVNVKQIKGN